MLCTPHVHSQQTCKHTLNPLGCQNGNPQRTSHIRTRAEDGDGAGVAWLLSRLLRTGLCGTCSRHGERGRGQSLAEMQGG